MAQKGFDILKEVTESRYLLSEIVGQRAAQLKRGVPSTVTGKAIPNTKNAVTAAMEELELGTGVIWGKDVSTAVTIKRAVESDEKVSKEAQAEYSVTQLDTRYTAGMDPREESRFGPKSRHLR